MTDSLPDYTALNVPDDKHPTEYTHHERRADLLHRCIEMGSPFAVNKTGQSDRYDVSRQTIHRDMNRLRESVGDSLGDDAKLTSKAVYERALLELRQADDWRASKAAFEMTMDWNEWLADIGEQHREPDKSELDMDVDMQSRQTEVSYQIVREDSDEPLPTEDDDSVDHEALGFTSGPAEIDVETTSSDGDGE